MTNKEQITKAYELAKEKYAEIGVSTDSVIEKMAQLQISLHNWQTDDVVGFEVKDEAGSGGGIQATGNYPGRATNIEQMQADLEKVMSMLPGKQRLNLHAIYGDFKGKQVDRNEIEVEHYQAWIDWAKKVGIGMDFNPSCFAHPKADTGFTLSSKDEEVRKFWVEHVARSRKIAAEIGKQLSSPCVNNIWIPDGMKDTPVDRNGYRAILQKSLDEARAEKYSTNYLKDAVESKVFGIGLEAMTVGSHEFYMGYAMKNNILLCLDNGHFHPAESVGDKISSCLLYVDELLLHVTRPIRWDSDHVVTLNEDVQTIASEIVRNNYLGRVNVGLDFFDASINRIGAYVTGTRAAQKAFLIAMLEPTAQLVKYEENAQYFERLAMLEELKTMPFAAVWDYYCMQENVPVGIDYIAEIQQYEKEVLAKR